jgi:hypothetical protein
MKMRKLVAACSFFIAGAVTLPALAQVNNGGFENPPTIPVTPNDWQYNGLGSGRDGTNPHSGSFEANLNNTTQASNANVQQQTAFGSIVPGTIYTLDFWAQADYGVGGLGQAQVAFLDSGAGILPGSPQFFNIPPSAGYVHYTQNYTAPVNSSALFLAFNSVTGAIAGSTAHVYVDDASFTALPEPASVAVIGLWALQSLGRRRAKLR